MWYGFSWLVSNKIVFLVLFLSASTRELAVRKTKYTPLAKLDTNIKLPIYFKAAFSYESLYLCCENKNNGQSHRHDKACSVHRGQFRVERSGAK
jgi:hypothetical protein